jgi:uncharacterized protein
VLVDNPVESVDKVPSAEKLQQRLNPCLGIFAKEPVAGQVKTRLCPPLTAAQAALLYEQALRETVAQLRALPLQLTLFYSGDADWFRRNFPRIRLLPQGAGDLGERMDRALATLLAEGPVAALVGSDSPDLPPALVSQALASLDALDVVTIPCRDGGYALIGESRHCPELFTEMPWSSNEVLAITRRRAITLGIAYHELGLWEDMDDLPSLLRLIERTPLSPTATLARQLLRRFGANVSSL